MPSRIDLQNELENILGNRNVYFQPPASVRMKYPCIRYSRNVDHVARANDRIYNTTRCYTVIVIDPDPDSVIPDAILARFPMCSMSNPYTADNLNHFPLTLYY